ncbi:hypothetical protein I302_101255 [Kwoniella bestiolae CBS 10118]|uniref:Uncharacterized protein n=1 Tax=Kwoniella bestiolae CBS 10118 TaxID=1296100 RepID=A0A1B9G7E4_9TREE|nr:hypothetical protein I302_04627 [Kwoniella bestiolae CBS 10118]OCF26936.1 hypothetical protein I302_04627 [Kwoniella bestiolae CBS 10118]
MSTNPQTTQPAPTDPTLPLVSPNDNSTLKHIPTPNGTMNRRIVSTPLPSLPPTTYALLLNRIDSIESTLKAEIGHLKTQLAEERGISAKLQSKVDQLEGDISGGRAETREEELLKERPEVSLRRVEELEKKGDGVACEALFCEENSKVLVGDRVSTLEDRYQLFESNLTAKVEEMKEKILKNIGDIEAIDSAIHTILRSHDIANLEGLTFKHKMDLFITHIYAQVEEEKRIGKTFSERMGDLEVSLEDETKEYHQGLDGCKKWVEDEMEKWKNEMNLVVEIHERRFNTMMNEVEGKAGMGLDMVKERSNDVVAMMEEFQVEARLTKEELENKQKEYLSTICDETSQAMKALNEREKVIQMDQDSFLKSMDEVRDEIRIWKEGMELDKKNVQEQREELKEKRDDYLREIRKAEDDMRNMIDRVEKGVGSGGSRRGDGKVCTVISWDHGGTEDWYSCEEK